MTRRPVPLSDRLAIPGIHRILAGFNVLVFVLLLINPTYGQWLALEPNQIMQGQVWRALTGFLLPMQGGSIGFSLILLLIKCQLLLMMGSALESTWGAKKLNLLVIGTAIAVTLSTLVIYLIYPELGMALGPRTHFNLYFVIFFCFAAAFPDTELRLFFVLPVKVKYLAIFAAVVTLASVPGHWLALVHTLGCYSVLLFFLLPELAGVLNARYRRETFKRSVVEAARNANLANGRTCSICGASEADDPQREFRVLENGDDICMPCVEKKRSKSGE